MLKQIRILIMFQSTHYNFLHNTLKRNIEKTLTMQELQLVQLKFGKLV